MGEQLRIGVIGAGQMAEHHLRVLSAFDDVEVMALCNRGRERLDEVGDRFDIPQRYRDYEVMLREANLDGVLVLVSVPNTVKVSASCLETGLPTFIEKPPGLSSAETRYLMGIADSTGALNMVGLNRRFYGNLQAAIDVIREHGPLVSIVVEAPERFAQIKAKGRFAPETLGRWIIANGVHCIDLLPYIGGKIAAVHAASRRWFEPDHPDSLHALIEFESGALGHYVSNWNAPGRWSVTLVGKACRIEMRPLEEGVVYLQDGREFPLPVAPVDREYKPGLYQQDRYFVEACKGTHPIGYPAATLEDSLVSMELAETLLAAAFDAEDFPTCIA